MKMNQSVKAMAKPYLTGSPTDEHTLRNALKFFGILVLTMIMTFIFCSMMALDSTFLRILINTIAEVLVLFIFFAKGADAGTDGVARGEILYQHIQKGQDPTPGERRMPFHRFKGFLNGFLGTLILLVPALILAFTAERTMTGAGTLPSWMEAYSKRTEISGPLVSYTQTGGVSFTDVLRIIVRMSVMPFISMAGAENRDLLLTVERLSPLLVLLPSFAYGLGYLTGPAKRKQIHTSIAENNKKRRIREQKARRRKITPKEPQQLN